MIDSNSFEVTTAVHDWNQNEIRKGSSVTFASDQIKVCIGNRIYVQQMLYSHHLIQVQL